MTPMKLIILDRDGTINEDRDDFVKTPDEWVPLPGALEAIARLGTTLVGTPWSRPTSRGWAAAPSTWPR